jgi:hypothetical protein
VIETRVADPMFHLGLYKIQAFAAGNVANLLQTVARGGPTFMLIIWLQGVWPPLHGYEDEDSAPNTSAIMNAVPADQRGQAAGMLVAEPFHSGLVIVFTMSIAMCVISAMRGGYYVHTDVSEDTPRNG